MNLDKLSPKYPLYIHSLRTPHCTQRCHCTTTWPTFQDIQTDSTKFVDVWMIYFCEEANFRRCHWVFLRQEELQFEHP